MVYCGRPSAICALCRAKKRRCDKALPSCGQCRRTGKQCPGYRDASTVLFRDETTRIIGRARSRREQRSGDPPLNVENSSTSDLSGPLQPVHRPLAIPIDNLRDLGIRYFLVNFVVPESGPCPGFFHYALNLVSSEHANGNETELARTAARAAVRAVGLASLSNATAASEGTAVLCEARRSYTEAIACVNAALADMQTASRCDSTILAVLVLGLFETITCANDASLEAWQQHVDGAANLLTHRGKAQFRTAQGWHIFGEALSHVLVLCSRFGRPVPPRLRVLRTEWTRQQSFVKTVNPSLVLSTVHIEVLDLLHRIDSDRAAPFLPDDWELLLSHTAELDCRLEQLMQQLLSETANSAPVQWQFSTVCDPHANPRVVYGGTYHVYSNVWVAKIWNGIRSCRIFLQHIIYTLLMREAVAWAPSTVGPGDNCIYHDLLMHVGKITTAMCNDILASVPQMLGFVQIDPATGLSSIHCLGGGDMSRQEPAAGAYFLLWALFLAGCLPVNPASTRTWVVDRLRTIRAATGIQQAAYLANTLEADQDFFGAELWAKATPLPDERTCRRAILAKEDQN